MTHRYTPPSNNGFTLIELLIVMIIISIVASIAVITLNTNPRKQYETFANQLANSILLAEQEAMLRPATLGLGFTSHSWQFFILEKDEWVPLKNPHEFPSHTQLTFKLTHSDTPPEKLIIPPSNDLTPFIILIGKQHEKPYYQIIGKANGEIISEPVPTK